MGQVVEGGGQFGQGFEGPGRVAGFVTGQEAAQRVGLGGGQLHEHGIPSGQSGAQRTEAAQVLGQFARQVLPFGEGGGQSLRRQRPRGRFARALQVFPRFGRQIAERHFRQQQLGLEFVGLVEHLEQGLLSFGVWRSGRGAVRRQPTPPLVDQGLAAALRGVGDLLRQVREQFEQLLPLAFLLLLLRKSPGHRLALRRREQGRVG